VLATGIYVCYRLTREAAIYWVKNVYFVHYRMMNMYHKFEWIHISRYYTNMCLEGLKKTMEPLGIVYVPADLNQLAVLLISYYIADSH
jgi:hypothetical protein